LTLVIFSSIKKQTTKNKKNNRNVYSHNYFLCKKCVRNNYCFSFYCDRRHRRSQLMFFSFFPSHLSLWHIDPLPQTNTMEEETATATASTDGVGNQQRTLSLSLSLEMSNE